jgi:hypothetical protein
MRSRGPRTKREIIEATKGPVLGDLRGPLQLYFPIELDPAGAAKRQADFDAIAAAHQGGRSRPPRRRRLTR